MTKQKNNDAHTFSRRRFLGVSALTSASAIGLTTISLSATQKAQAGWFSPTELVQPQAPDGIATVSYTHLTLPTSDLV